MKIKRLELQGFKSFADRSVLHFGEGITGVLGPNGCGKSNIVDALRWAMGEQSAKHLRGSGMEDVIFAGSESRGPMGMAEVTITFKNDGHLVPPEYKKLSEISVTRRLFRDGTSQYLINKQVCRLRDVQELFMGTGIGTKSYAIIEQGRIGLVVTAKPEDRRALIEDAAGITKYKSRRRSAERKLDATEQNLLRVSDIVGELGKRLGTLEKQAAKAETYKALKGELKSLDLVAAVHRHLELSALERFEAAAVHDRRDELDAAETAMSEEEAAISAALEQLSADEADLREEEAQVHGLEQALAVGAKNVEHLVRELDGLQKRKREAEAERVALSEQLALATEERDDVERAAGDLDSATDSDAVRLDAVLAELATIEASIANRETQLERDKQALVECLTAIAQQDNNLGNLQRSASDLDVRVAKLEGDSSDADGQARQYEGRAAEAREQLDGNRQLKLALDDRKTAQEGLLERYSAEFVQNEAALIGLREELMDKRSRLSSLEEIQRNYEGCQVGVRAVMRRKEEDATFQHRLHGLVADVLSAEPRYETAVEAVLGERLQYVIVGNQDDGVTSIDYLKTTADGRSSFIPLDLREDHVSWAPRRSSRPPHSISDLPPPPEIQAAADVAQAALLSKTDDRVPSGATVLPVPALASEDWDGDNEWPDLHASGVHGKMVDLVNADPGFDQVKRVLLGDVVVVESLDEARALWKSNGHRKTLVTLSGDVLDPVGVITGGATEGVSAGMLAQKREINELLESVNGLDARVRLAEDRHHTLRKRVNDIEAEISGLSADGHAEELSIVKLEQDVRAFLETAAGHAERKLQIGRALDEVRGERAAIAAQLEQSGGALDALGQRKAAADARVKADLEALNDDKAKAAAVGARVTELKVAVAATSEKRESFERSLHQICSRIDELGQRLARLADVIEAGISESERLGDAIEAGSTEGVHLTEQIASRKAELGTRTEAHADQARRLKEEDAAIRARRKDLDEVKDDVNAALMRRREYELAREALGQQIDERYQIELLDVVREYHDAPLQTAKDTEQRQKLRRKIDRMGEINLTAIREFEEVKERFDFLDGQQADLNKAIATLKAAIKKIDGTSEKRFAEAFALVKEKFEIVFPRLFNGGTATLEITDPSNPLESGIELLAQPPGKKLQSVNLLSGGEKALTAIALIFSIFLIKPTPFCLLDEVDAPLDDANVGRYNEMVRDMASLSQFILITHNKRTMEIPDRLYGVTMETPGISKLVGVDIKTTEYQLELAS